MASEGLQEAWTPEICSIILSDGGKGSLSGLGASRELLWVCPGTRCLVSQEPRGIPVPAQGGLAAPSPWLRAAQPPPLRVPVLGGIQGMPGAFPAPRVCPGQANPRNLGPGYKKPRGCSVPRGIWECLGLELGLSRCPVITQVLLQPHQSCQPLISGSSWHDKGTVLSPALCTKPGLGFGWGWDTAPL